MKVGGYSYVAKGMTHYAWFTEEIIVRGKHIVTKVDGKTVVDYTEPEGTTGDRRISHGTFALQGHDPGSKVCYKNIRVKVLPD